MSASISKPNSWAIAGICNKEFVDPDIAACTIIAFSKLFIVTISEAFKFISASLTAILPASRAAVFNSFDVAGIKAVPGNIRPNASAIICIVLAVPMKEHAPHDGQACVL